MGRLVTLGIRNLLRNKRRSALTLAAIFFGVAVYVFINGFINAFIVFGVNEQVLGRFGPLQVHRRGYLEEEQNPLKRDMEEGGALEKKILAVPGVTAASPRILFEGMLSNGSVSTMFVGTAIDPAREYRVCPKRVEQVTIGSRPLDEKARGEALIGKQLAAALEAKEGSSVTMLSATQAGASNALDVTVRGFLPSKTVIESKRLATVPLAYAQDLLRMEGRATEYAVGVASLEQVDEVAARLKAALGDGYEVHTWREVALQARDTEARLRYVMIFVAAMLLLLVLTGIVNTMLMSVHERVREIGTMMAVGVRRRQVLLLFLVEAGALGLLGALSGASLGLGVVRWLGARGLTIQAPGADTPFTLHPYVAIAAVATVVGVAAGSTVLAALWPSWKASRLRPVEALRSV